MTEYGRIHKDGSRSGGQPTQSDAIERALCEANGCVWNFDPDSDSRKQWRRDVETVLTALQGQSK